MPFSASLNTKRLLLSTFGVGALCSSTFAEIEYRVKVNTDSHRVEIKLEVPGNGRPTSVQMPAWMPGHYVLDEYSKDVQGVQATDEAGNSVPLDHPDANTWAAPATTKRITFSYWVPIGAYKRFTLPEDNSFLEIAGPANYMYVQGRKNEPCKISFELPTGFPALTSLDPVRGELNTFKAPNYDVLADNPLSTGDVLVDRYRLRGKDETVILEGSNKISVDRTRLDGYCKFVSAAEADFFGGPPYHRYGWHFIVNTGPSGGGLEHLSSTQITLPNRLNAGTISLLAHEHFHLWNVKRIRPKVLGPFDYQSLPKTGALWWCEGVTDYYASLLPYRYGAWQRDLIFRSIANNYGQALTNSSRLQTSPYESSYRLAEAASAKGTGSNGGYKISFYTFGFLCGVCLDLEIRSRSNNQHSLDDVMRALFDECKNDQPGFEEDEIRKQCVRFGGPELGTFYDRIVMTPGELPIVDELAKAGLLIGQETAQLANLGFDAVAGPDGKTVVRRVSPSQTGVLKQGDTITEVDGFSSSAKDPYRVADLLSDYSFANHTAALKVTVIREGQTMELLVQPSIRSQTRWQISEDPKASDSAVRVRQDWLRTIKLAG